MDIYVYKNGFEINVEFARWNPNSCAVRERTADGDSVGPCMFYLESGVKCPRHGIVKEKKPLEE